MCVTVQPAGYICGLYKIQTIGIGAYHLMVLDHIDMNQNNKDVAM